MYTSLESIIMETTLGKNSICIKHTNMSCATEIMKNLYKPLLHTKFNLNNMVVIGQFLLNSLNWNTSVSQTKDNPHYPWKVAHVMMCFTNLCPITENKIQIQQLHIEGKKMRFWIRNISCFWYQYYMGEYIWMCRALHMCYIIKLMVNIVAGLCHSYWTWDHCNSTWQRGCRRTKFYIQKSHLPPNGHCATPWKWTVWYTDESLQIKAIFWC